MLGATTPLTQIITSHFQILETLVVLFSHYIAITSVFKSLAWNHRYEGSNQQNYLFKAQREKLINRPLEEDHAYFLCGLSFVPWLWSLSSACPRMPTALLSLYSTSLIPFAGSTKTSASSLFLYPFHLFACSVSWFQVPEVPTLVPGTRITSYCFTWPNFPCLYSCCQQCSVLHN